MDAFSTTSFSTTSFSTTSSPDVCQDPSLGTDKTIILVTGPSSIVFSLLSLLFVYKLHKFAKKKKNKTFLNFYQVLLINSISDIIVCVAYLLNQINKDKKPWQSALIEFAELNSIILAIWLAIVGYALLKKNIERSNTSITFLQRIERSLPNSPWYSPVAISLIISVFIAILCASLHVFGSSAAEWGYIDCTHFKDKPLQLLALELVTIYGWVFLAFFMILVMFVFRICYWKWHALLQVVFLIVWSFPTVHRMAEVYYLQQKGSVPTWIIIGHSTTVLLRGVLNFIVIIVGYYIETKKLKEANENTALLNNQAP